jgi:hypothetical protein
MNTLLCRWVYTGGRHPNGGELICARCLQVEEQRHWCLEHEDPTNFRHRIRDGTRPRALSGV